MTEINNVIVVPVSLQYLPGVQSVQSPSIERPSEIEKVPMGHGVGAGEPSVQ